MLGCHVLRLWWALPIALTASACAPVLGIEDTRYESPDECLLVPTRLHFAEALDHDAAVTIAAITKLELAELAADVDATLDPARGHLIATILDCGNQPISGASLGLAPPAGAATLFVIDEGASPATETGDPGLIGAFNLPVGEPLALQALPSEIVPNASSSAKIVLSPGELSAIVLGPTSGLPPPASPPSSLQCVGTTPEPMTSASSVSLTVSVIEAQELEPNGEQLANIEVRACAEGDETCSIVAITKDEGVATLTLPVTEGRGFEGSITIAGSHSDCP